MRMLELLGRQIMQAFDRATPKWPPQALSLALQGGGSFGAFTSGVLDRLLTEPDIRFDTLSGASAGAINAVLLAAGLAEGGREAAREKLETFWRRLSHAAPFLPFGSTGAMIPGAAGTLSFWTRLVSPYQYNPFDLNPLRAILNEEIDFERLRRKKPVGLLISATRVSDGRARIFRNEEIDADAVLASACLPLLHHAIMIGEETYWDGGYSSNPPLHELVTTSATPEILIVQITPAQGIAMPTSSQEIMRRLDQITFNASLLAETGRLARYADIYRGIPGYFARDGRKWRQLTLHRIIAEEQVAHLAEANASNLDWNFLSDLREHGRDAAENWLRSKAEKASAAISRNEAVNESICPGNAL
ncbi:MAG: patatin-like phospholipase family protein [Beijerinckiaceae bacterium]|nr:MAG: patatin-like phospholipase family protein [Beijerinckiaceae bacterium]